jgi:hypothetical protein
MKTRTLCLSFLFLVEVSFTLGQVPFSIKLMNGFATIKNNGHQNYIQIGWQTTLEKGFNYYDLQRRVHNDTSWQTLGRIDTLSTSDTAKTYLFSDYPVSAASYDYRVRISLNDTPRVYITIAVVTLSSLTDVSISTNQNVPVEYETLSNYPNPFNPSTKITLSLPVSERISLEIFDLLGRKVETIAEGFLSQGIYQYQWDASKYPSGVYLCALRTMSSAKVAKLLLQK